MAILDGVMRWSRCLFVHWRVDGARLLPLLPPGVLLDAYRGDALVSLAALEVRGPLPKLGSSVTLAGSRRYRQVNLRTYVVGEHGPGIALLETWVDRRLPQLGARLVGMPYRVARPISLSVGDQVSLITPDVRVSGRTVDEPRPTAPATLEHFALDRMWLYGRLPGGFGYGVQVAHAPWIWRPAEVHVEFAGPLPLVDGAGEPIAAEVAEHQDVAVVAVVASHPAAEAQTEEAPA